MRAVCRSWPTPDFLSFKDSKGLSKFVDELVKEGLAGIEVYYTDHSTTQQKMLAALAAEKNLMATGGSDFHGSFNKGVELGWGKGDLKVPKGVFKAFGGAPGRSAFPAAPRSSGK